MKHSIKLVLAVIVPVATLLLTTIIIEGHLKAQLTEKMAKSGITYKIEYRSVDKAEVLEKFFDKYNSPLKPYAKDFVRVADMYNMDYKLLPSISCIESSCGKKLIPGSNNPFGWGIYGNKVTTFDSYPQAIETVGKGLNENYITKGYDTVEEIAPIYTPPAYQHWSKSVNFFSDQISDIEQKEI